jgi:hypothetical protein
MPLAIGGGGSSRPYIRFTPQGNAWLKSTDGGSPVEFAFDRDAAVDIQNIQLGWLLLDAGARDWQAWPNNVRTSKPGATHSEGFSLAFMSKAMFGGDQPVRELCSSQAGVVTGIKALYDECEQHPEFAAGKTPIVRLTGAALVKMGKGNTRIPKFEIVKWVDRPAEFAEFVGSDAPQSQAKTNTPPPQQQRQPEPQNSSAEF